MRRRTWLLTAAAGAGALVVGWGALPQRSRVGGGRLMRVTEGDVALNGWIKIAADGSAILAMPRSEMGQGVYTALPMLAAEELDLPLGAMRIEQAGTDTIYGNVTMLLAGLPFHPRHQEQEEKEDGFGRVKASRWVVGKVARELGINATGGSSSVADAWPVVRLAAATARSCLLGAASLQWKLPLDELSAVDGVVSHPSGKSAGYGELARFAAATPPGTVRLKERSAWKLIGLSPPRLDVPAKTDGSARFGLDVRLPGMLYAAIRLCPVLGGSPGSVDAAAALAMPGAQRLVMLPAYAGSTAGMAVVGQTSWHARRAVDAVAVEWQPPPGPAPDSRLIANRLRQAIETGGGTTFFSQGNAAEAEQGAARVLESWYDAPYLAHATLEPMNCTARVAAGKVEIWVPTQVPQMCAAIAAQVAGVAVEDVTVQVTLLGGGFGRRLEVDYVAQAVRVAMDCAGAPVQLGWSREQDTTHDFYRPMHAARIRAALDDKGRVTSLRIHSAGDAISPRWMARAVPALSGRVDLPDKTTAEGLFDQPYAIAHQQMAHMATRMGVPVGFWRSVGHSHNAFFIESFMDELAAAAGEDPVAFRLRLLEGAPRHQAVLQLAASRAGWGGKLTPGRARGVALHESFGSIVAQVAEVSIRQGVPQVHRVVCAVDCGTVIHPGIVAQQMEGAVVYALSAALYGRVDIHQGTVQQANFPAYRMLDLRESPLVETWIVPQSRPPAGVGEPGVPPMAPALANALFALTGRRLRSLPLAPTDL